LQIKSSTNYEGCLYCVTHFITFRVRSVGIAESSEFTLKTKMVKMLPRFWSPLLVRKLLWSISPTFKAVFWPKNTKSNCKYRKATHIRYNSCKMLIKITLCQYIVTNHSKSFSFNVSTWHLGILELSYLLVASIFST